MMTLSSIQKKIGLIISIFTLIGMLYTGYIWFSNTIVTKNDLMLAVNDIRLGQIEESLARYHRIGISKLTDQEKHRYEKLLLAEKANDKQRKNLLGI